MRLGGEETEINESEERSNTYRFLRVLIRGSGLPGLNTFVPCTSITFIYLFPPWWAFGVSDKALSFLPLPYSPLLLPFAPLICFTALSTIAFLRVPVFFLLCRTGSLSKLRQNWKGGE